MTPAELEKMAEEYKPDSTCLEELHIGCLTRDAFLSGFRARDGEVRELRSALVIAMHHMNDACDPFHTARNAAKDALAGDNT